MNHSKNTFCNYCGNVFNPNQSYPKQCVSCENITYNSPVPVIVSVVFVKDNLRLGVLVIKRNTEPQKGQWAMPGGYLEPGESYKVGAARELLEETGLDLDPEKFLLADVENASNGNLIIFADYMVVDKNKIKFTPTEEASEIKVIFKAEELAFPTHTKVVSNIFKEIGNELEKLFSKTFDPNLSN